MAVLPLFPLGTVLMPGAQLPLQVFEPRYLQLLRDLIENQDRQVPVFGVVAIREGHEVGADGVRALHAVGCAAQLTQAAALGDNRFLVISTGISRFRLEGVGTDVGAVAQELGAQARGEDGDGVAVAEGLAQPADDPGGVGRAGGLVDPLEPEA